MRNRGIALVTAAVLIGAAFFLASAADEADLLRQIKSDIFDVKWDAVLASCDQFITQFPSSHDMPRAMYYRAQALEHAKGRDEDAIAAYGEFLTRFPNESGTLREDALLSRMTLAVSLWLKGNRGYAAIILKGMDEKGYPRLFAAIQASKIDLPAGRAKALPILKECAKSESDVELKNECVVALLRIDPKALEASAPPDRLVPGAAPQPGAAKLIRLEVFDKHTNKPTVTVNLPLAFAELILETLGDAYRQKFEDNIPPQYKGMNLESFWNAIKKGGKQTIIEIDNEDEHIKVWVE